MSRKKYEEAETNDAVETTPVEEEAVPVVEETEAAPVDDEKAEVARKAARKAQVPNT